MVVVSALPSLYYCSCSETLPSYQQFNRLNLNILADAVRSQYIRGHISEVVVSESYKITKPLNQVLTQDRTQYDLNALLDHAVQSVKQKKLFMP